ncbi:MAG: arginine N-succinyltransferase [Verrucomicrobiales bacterium]|nr:arginine N-succinyltransferase [Verrucomicrobiales bacterium]
MSGNPVNLVLRPVVEDDLKPLLTLLKSIPDSITSLQPDPEYLEKRIHQSLRSLYPVVTEPGDEKYFFVLEDTVKGCLAGTCAIYARTGGFEPFYTYEIIEEVRQYKPLDIETRLSSLRLRTEHEGPSELGGLFLHSDYRGGGNGGALSRSRFLFAKSFPERFTREVMAEFRGVVTEQGEVPFWDAVGRHFFVRDFFSLDQYSAVARKDFIHDLMPRHPLYIPLLPKKAQRVIGKPHPATEPAVHVLEKEGFQYINQVDIFDAGPIYQAVFSGTKSYRSACEYRVQEIVNETDEDALQHGLIANTKLDFRALSGAGKIQGESILLTREIADALQVEPGENVLFLASTK